MTDEFPIESKIELLMILYGYSLEEAQKLAADPDVEVFDVIVEGKAHIGRSIYAAEDDSEEAGQGPRPQP